MNISRNVIKMFISHGLFWVQARPLREGVTLLRLLSLASPCSEWSLISDTKSLLYFALRMHTNKLSVLFFHGKFTTEYIVQLECVDTGNENWQYRCYLLKFTCKLFLPCYRVLLLMYQSAAMNHHGGVFRVLFHWSFVDAYTHISQVLLLIFLTSRNFAGFQRPFWNASSG